MAAVCIRCLLSVSAAVRLPLPAIVKRFYSHRGDRCKSDIFLKCCASIFARMMPPLLAAAGVHCGHRAPFQKLCWWSTQMSFFLNIRSSPLPLSSLPCCQLPPATATKDNAAPLTLCQETHSTVRSLMPLVVWPSDGAPKI